MAKIPSLTFRDLRTAITEQSAEIPQSELGSSSWSMSDPLSSKLCSQLEEKCVQLDEYRQEQIYRGVLTGLNDAFIIDQTTKREIVDKDPGSDQFIFKMMRGDDAERYISSFSGEYLIRVPSGWTSSESGINGEDGAWDWFKSTYPGLAEHLREFKEDASSRYDRGEFWWELRPCDYYDKFNEPKIVYPEISDGPRFSFDEKGKYTNNKCFILPQRDFNLLAVLNSKVGELWSRNRLSTVRGGYLEYRAVHLSNFPVPDFENDVLSQKVEQIIEHIQNRRGSNLSLLDHLGSYSEGPTFSEIGFTQPPENAADSILQQTTEEKPNLRVGEAEVVRESDTTVDIRLTARYKPDDDSHETDQWGYTETDPLPALRITDLTETEADLIEAFVPVAVDEAGGFANFRETATKTNSLVDRLRKLTLPRLSDVEDGLESYIETKERADELEEKIQRTDNLIDEIVYELYGLTEEEIEIVEESVEK